MSDLSGKVVRDYELREKIGSGGFSDVYRAQRLSNGIDVAVKVILPQYTTRPELVRRFNREADIITRLENPHIVRLFDYWQDNNDNSIYLVMQWLKEGSLRKIVQHGPLPIDMVLKLFDQIGEALTLAHKAGIVHRDLKPDNILLDEDHNACLTDFGIAKDLISSTAGFTTSNQALGTVAYAAPEQLSGQLVSPQADIYSLGIMLYECVAGEYPFRGNPMQHLVSPLPSLQQQRTDAPLALDVVIARATAKDPTDRYANVETFLDALRNAFQRNAPPMGTTTDVLPQLPLIPVVSPRPKIGHFTFVSHSTKDDTMINRIAEQLEAAGVNLWIDHRNIDPGDDWFEAIQQALTGCKDALFVLSAESAASLECRSEWRTILDYQKPLYVALIGEVPTTDFPYRLRTIQYVDLRSDFEAGITRLVKDMRQPREIHEIRTMVGAPAQYLPPAQSATLIKTAGDLPQRAEKLIGREAMIGEVEKLLKDRRRVLLQGFGGMGKTALASEIVARHVEQNQAPVLWLQASSGNASTLFEAIMTSFGGQPITTGNDTPQRTIRAMLSEQKVQLMVLDDIWIEGTELRQVIDALPPQLPVLATSRNRYPLGRILDVGELNLDQALELLSEFAPKRYTLEDKTAVELCEKLGFHPYALEIASKTLSVYDLTPGELLKRIHDTPHTLKMPEDMASAGREGIKELLDTSITALQPPERELYLAFGALFVPNGTSALLSLITGRKPENIETVLTGLIQHGLLTKVRLDDANIYYHMHDLAHSYARANTSISAHDVLQACLKYAQEHKTNLHALDLEKNNLLGAAKRATQVIKDQPDESQVLIDLMVALAVEGPYFGSRGYPLNVIELMQLAVSAATVKRQKKPAHYLLGKLGDAYAHFRGELDKALKCYRDSLELARQLEDLYREGVLLTVIGTTRSRQNADDANIYYDEAYRIAKEINNDALLSMVLEHRGHQAYFNKDYQSAHKFFKDALNLAEHLGDDQRLFFALINVGGAEHDLGNFRDALPYYEKAYQLGEKTDNQYWLALTSEAIGEQHHSLLNTVEAQVHFDKALTLYSETGDVASSENLLQFMQKHHYPLKEKAK